MLEPVNIPMYQIISKQGNKKDFYFREKQL